MCGMTKTSNLQTGTYSKCSISKATEPSTHGCRDGVRGEDLPKAGFPCVNLERLFQNLPQ